MGREDYYRRKARELLVAACATRDSGAADWLRAMAFGYERLAKKAAHSPHGQYLPRLKWPDHGRCAVRRAARRERAARTLPSLVVAQSGIQPNSRHAAAEIQLNAAK